MHVINFPDKFSSVLWEFCIYAFCIQFRGYVITYIFINLYNPGTFNVVGACTFTGQFFSERGGTKMNFNLCGYIIQSIFISNCVAMCLMEFSFLSIIIITSFGMMLGSYIINEDANIIENKTV